MDAEKLHEADRLLYEAERLVLRLTEARMAPPDISRITKISRVRCAAEARIRRRLDRWVALGGLA